MKSNLINRRKKAAVLVSPETLRMAIQEGRSIIPTFQSKKDPRLAQLMKAVQWLERVEASPMGKTNLDDGHTRNMPRPSSSTCSGSASLRPGSARRPSWSRQMFPSQPRR